MMKNILIILLCAIAINGFAQVIDEETKKKFTIGLDVFTDIWQDVPEEQIKTGTINPGVNIFGTYNFIFGESNISFSPGLGIGVHNMFNHSLVRTTHDSTFFVPIKDTLPGVDYRKSKFVLTYLDIPLELRYKSEGGLRVAIGFKFGFLIQSHTKYKGPDYIETTHNDLVIYKKTKIKYLETNRYGFTARIGYKWLNLWGYYQLSTLFEKGKGPEMYPISVGLTIIPF